MSDINAKYYYKGSEYFEKHPDVETTFRRMARPELNVEEARGQLDKNGFDSVFIFEPRSDNPIEPLYAVLGKLDIVHRVTEYTTFFVELQRFSDGAHKEDLVKFQDFVVLPHPADRAWAIREMNTRDPHDIFNLARDRIIEQQRREEARQAAEAQRQREESEAAERKRQAEEVAERKAARIAKRIAGQQHKVLGTLLEHGDLNFTTADVEYFGELVCAVAAELDNPGTDWVMGEMKVFSHQLQHVLRIPYYKQVHGTPHAKLSYAFTIQYSRNNFVKLHASVGKGGTRIYQYEAKLGK